MALKTDGTHTHTPTHTNTHPKISNSFIMSIECSVHIHILFALVPNSMLNISPRVAFSSAQYNLTLLRNENCDCVALALLFCLHSYVYCTGSFGTWGYNYILASLDLACTHFHSNVKDAANQAASISQAQTHTHTQTYPHTMLYTLL